MILKGLLGPGQANGLFLPSWVLSPHSRQRWEPQDTARQGPAPQSTIGHPSQHPAPGTSRRFAGPGGPHLITENAPQNTSPSSRLPSTYRSLTINTHELCWPLGFSQTPLPEAARELCYEAHQRNGLSQNMTNPI